MILSCIASSCAMNMQGSHFVVHDKVKIIIRMRGTRVSLACVSPIIIYLQELALCVNNLRIQPMASASGQQSPLRWQEALHEQRSAVPILISHSPLPDISLQHDEKPASLQILWPIIRAGHVHKGLMAGIICNYLKNSEHLDSSHHVYDSLHHNCSYHQQLDIF